MGRFFFDCPGGKLIYSCRNCQTHLSNVENVISEKFRGATGTAYLFDNVINVEYAGVELKTMLTGKHMVRDAYCKNCKARVGWMYEFAYDAEQEYKEGKVILERELIEESMGIDDKLTHGTQSTIGVASDNRAQQDILDRSQRNSSSSSLNSNASQGSGSSGSGQGVPNFPVGARIHHRLSTSASQTGLGGFGAQIGAGVGPLGSRHMPVRFMVRWGGENPQQQGHHTGQFGTSYSSGTSSSSSSGGTGRVAQSSGTGRNARMAQLMNDSSTSSSSRESESRASSHSGSPSITSSTSSASIRGSGSSPGSSPEEARRRGPSRGSPISGGGGGGGGSGAIRFGRRSLRFSRGSR